MAPTRAHCATVSQDDMNPDMLEHTTLDNLGFELYSDEQYKTDVDSFTEGVSEIF